MPDLPPLPPAPSRPVIVPRTGDLPVVYWRASRRRRAQAGATAVVASSALFALVAMSAYGGGTSSLHTVDPAGPGGSVASGPPAAAAAAPPGAAAPSTAPSPAPLPAESPEPEESPGGSSPAPEADRSAQPARPRPVVRRDDVPLDPSLCERTDLPPVTESDGWCLVFPGNPFVVTSGEARDYALLACRETGRGTGTLRFSTEQQVDFVVERNYRREWHWSAGYPFAARPTGVDVAEGRCARWTVTWDTTGDDGDLLPPAEYEMSALLLQEDPPGARYAPYATLTITE